MFGPKASFTPHKAARTDKEFYFNQFLPLFKQLNIGLRR